MGFLKSYQYWAKRNSNSGFETPTNRLIDQKEERELGTRAERSAEENNVCGDVQDSGVEEDHDT